MSLTPCRWSSSGGRRGGRGGTRSLRKVCNPGLELTGPVVGQEPEAVEGVDGKECEPEVEGDTGQGCEPKKNNDNFICVTV